MKTAREGEQDSEEVEGAPVEGGGVGVLGGGDEGPGARRAGTVKAASKAKRGAPGDSDSD